MARFPNDLKLLGKNESIPEELTSLIDGQDQKGTLQSVSKKDQKNLLYSFSTNPEYNFVIMSAVDMDSYFSSWKRNSLILCGVGISFIIFAILFLKHYLLSLERIDQQKSMLLESSKMATLGEMAGGIAHEINNPLAIIAGLNENMKLLLSEPNPTLSEINPMLERVDSTVKRIALIVKGLKSISRQGTQDPMQYFSASKLMSETISLCKEKIESKNVTLNFSNSIETTILGRESQISQVILNLISNGLDAAGESQKRQVTVSTRIEGTKFQIRVADSGSGISQENEKKIFYPFFTTKEVGKGTGLGLSISKGIVEDHGGKLYLDRTSPETEFVVELNSGKN